MGIISELHRFTGSRQQAKKRTWIASGTFCENRANNKLARMSVVMHHLKTIAMIFCTSLNGTITSKYALIMLERALGIEKFYHSRMVTVCIG